MSVSVGRWKIARRTVQILVILLLVSPALGLGIFRGTLISGELLGVSFTDPLAALDYTLAAKTLSATVLAGALAVIIFYFLVGGRTFCSWVCPVHLVSEIGGRLRIRSGGLRLRAPSSMKYWVLAVVLVLSLAASRPVFEIVSPIGALTQNLALAGPGLAFNSSLLLVLFVFLIEVAGGTGWWCGAVCPVAAIYALAGRWSPTRVAIDHGACNNCGDCFRVCMVPHVLKRPVQKQSTRILSGDCSNCMNCVDACTRDALKPRFSLTGRK